MLRMPRLNGWSLNRRGDPVPVDREIERGGPAEAVGLAGVDVDGREPELEPLFCTLPTLSKTAVNPVVAVIGRSSSRSLVFFW